MRTNLAILAAAVIAATPAAAKWSDDPAQNLCLGDRPNQQGQPRMVATPDGGCYVSWLDAADGDYDVYLQRLDANGCELWPHNGVLVADRSFTSNQCYGLDIDTAGNALLAFRDDRSGPDQITANKVSPDGTLLWGDAGIQMPSSGPLVAQPKIAAASDGNSVVAWVFGDDMMLQRLDQDGSFLWDEPVTLDDPDGGIFWMNDLHGADDGSVILSMRRDGPMYWDPKHIWAQKFDPDGKPLWGSTPLVVFDGGSIQFGNFPGFIPDGLGGAVFSWYNTTPLQCHVQHVSAAGEELFPHNGALASTVAWRKRTNPSPAYNPDTDQTFLFWVEQWVDDQFIDYWAVYGQKFDNAGARQWTDAGLPVVPLETIERQQVRSLICDDGAMVFWAQETDFTEYCLQAARVDATGDSVWPDAPVPVSTRPTDKSKLFAIANTDGDAFLSWSDAAYELGDLYAQNVNTDGTLGIPDNPADVTGDGIVDVLDLLAVLAAWGPCPGCPEDINGDDVVDVLDLLAVLAAW